MVREKVIAIMRVKIVTHINKGKSRNEIVDIPISDYFDYNKVADYVEIIKKDGNRIAKASVAECLADNQSASIGFLIDGEVVGDTIIINPCGAK